MKLKVNIMGLVKNKPEFEGEDEGTAVAAAPEKVAQKPAATTAVVEKPAGALAAQRFDMRVMDTFKNALPVSYNTLAQITAQQGSILVRETITFLGDKIVFELLSFQD